MADNPGRGESAGAGGMPLSLYHHVRLKMGELPILRRGSMKYEFNKAKPDQ